MRSKVCAPLDADQAYQHGRRYALLTVPPPFDTADEYATYLYDRAAGHSYLTSARIAQEVEGYADALAGRPDRTSQHYDRDDEHELAWWQR